MIAVIAALEREMNRLRKKAGATGSKFACGSISGKEITLARTGMGRESVENTLGDLIREYKIEALISTGFAAGLDHKLQTGDILLAHRISSFPDVEAAISADSMVLEQAKAILDENKQNYWVGEILTCNYIAGKAAKMQLVDRKSIGLDMESFWVAKEAESNSIPYLIARVILDKVDDDLPTYICQGEEGYSYRAIFLHLVSHPGELLSYLRLAIASRRASQAISRLVTPLVGGLKV